MKDFRINWQLPAQLLGPAVRVEPEKKECPFLSFQTENRDWVIDPSFTETKKEEDPLLRAFKEDGIVREFRMGDRVKVRSGGMAHIVGLGCSPQVFYGKVDGEEDWTLFFARELEHA